MSCLPDDIMESVISCETAKATWTDLVYSFEGPSDTKENKIMDLKLEYQTFRAKPFESLSQTYTRYKTLLNELANDGVNLSKQEINVGFVNSLPKKWFVYEDNLIQIRYSDSKKALITTPLTTPISTAFFSNNVIQDFQENSNDEIDERTSEEYLRDLDIEFHERALLANSKYEEEVSNDEELTEVKVLIALAADELTVGKNHAHNGEWIDISMRKRHIREPIWYLDSGCSRSMTGVKSYLHEYVEQPGPKGFAVVLAVLVTGASQSRQHGKSESDSYYLSD
ncbi:hypothetical protein Tco_0294757 [Tanacetum coccineum]